MHAPHEADFESWFEEVWRLREEEALPALLGELAPGIVTLDQAPALTSQYEEWDPMFGSFGVLRSPATKSRPTWRFVTSGLTSPLNLAPGDEIVPGTPSGFGYELVLETESDANWALIRLLSMMAYNLGTRRAFAHGHRWPFGEAIDGQSSKLRASVIADLGQTFELPSGSARLLTVVGITDKELAFAKSSGSDALLAQLKKHADLVTRVARGSVPLV